MEASNKRALQDEDRIAVPRLLYALLGAPVSWSLHLLTSYFLVALACTTGWSGIRAALVAVTVVFGATAAGAGVVSYRTWRRFAGEQPWDAALSEPRTRSGFFMIVGMVLAALFVWIIVLAGLPPLFLPMCASGSAVATSEFPSALVLAAVGSGSIGMPQRWRRLRQSIDFARPLHLSPRPVRSRPRGNRRRPLRTGALVALAALCAAFGAACIQGEPPARPSVAGGDPTLGETAIRRYGCGTCHVVPGVPGARGKVGPPLTDWSERRYIAGSLLNTPDNLIGWIMNPAAIEPGTIMPDLGVSERQARHIAAYLYTLGDRSALGPPHLVPQQVLH